MVRSLATAAALLLNCSLGASIASAAPPGWPEKISGDEGFTNLGRAIKADPKFPKTGSDVEKARFVFSKLPEIAKTYNLKASDDEQLNRRIVQFGRLIESMPFIGDPEQAQSLKLGGVGNCSEWSFAFQNILMGCDVQAVAAYADKVKAPGYGGDFTRTDTMVYVVEQRAGKTSRRVFDAFRAGWDGLKDLQPDDDSIKDWGDLPMTETDRWKDDRGSWQKLKEIDKPYIKDAISETRIPEPSPLSRPGDLARPKEGEPDRPTKKVPAKGSVDDFSPLSEEHKELARRIEERRLFRSLGADRNDPPETDDERARRLNYERLKEQLKEAGTQSELAKQGFESNPNGENYAKYLKAESAYRDAKKQVDDQLVPVPDIVGQPISSALDILTQAKLGASPIRGTDAKNPNQASQVYYQDPSVGARVLRGTPVTAMFYSRSNSGKDTVKVPDVVGKSKEAAEAEITKAKLTPFGVPGKKKKPGGAKFNDVYVQVPQANTDVSIDSVVKFEYYAGIPVGKYAGMTKKEADKAIADIGLKPDVKPGELQARDSKDKNRVYEQLPKPGELASPGDIVSAKLYKAEGGFQVEDGKYVDARFAEAVVTDGEMPGTTGKSAGERTAIYFFPGKKAGQETQNRIGWSIRKFVDADSAKAEFDKLVKPMSMTKSSADGQFKVLLSDVGKTNAAFHFDLKTPVSEGSTYARVMIYRDVFVINFGVVEPKSGVEFGTQSTNIFKKSREVIDDRFPND